MCVHLNDAENNEQKGDGEERKREIYKEIDDTHVMCKEREKK